MSQTTVKPTISSETNDLASEISLIDMLAEIEATPKQYWPNLLQIIHSFRSAITLNLADVSNTITARSQQEEQIQKNQAAIELLRSWRESDDDLEQQEQNQLTDQHQALKELTREWLEEGDEQEQTKTYEYLSQTLEKVSI